MVSRFLMLSVVAVLGAPLGLHAQEPTSPWGDFVEADFPFFSSVLDGRDLGEGFPKDNLTPRGLVLNLGHNIWACYDLDLLRIACIWEGEAGKPPVTPEALAPGSYHLAGQKTKDGQDFLPKPVGKVLAVNGLYPGWQMGEKPIFEDPRESGPSVEEVGRGALPEGMARLQALTWSDAGVELEIVIGETLIHTRMRVESNRGKVILVEKATIEPHSQTLHVLHPGLPVADKARRAIDTVQDPDRKAMEPAMTWVSHSEIGPSKESQEFEAHTPLGNETAGNEKVFAAGYWGQTVTTGAEFAESKPTDSYVVDKIPLPVPNPWKRNVRLADIDFLDDQGNAVGVTFDGDVWLISGLKGDLEKVTWRRFASGLHEPMSIVVKTQDLKTQDSRQILASSSPGSGVFVYDRNGIWKLIDTDNDGQCDRYEMFCNLFAQTAETREFPNSMKLGPDGSLFISKGGQEGTTRGKHNGTVIKVAADGKSFEVIGHGLRQPFIGVHPVTGLVTASDQQGNWVPSTPIQVIRDNQFYGHLPNAAKGETYPEKVAEPLVWLPHPVNPSGATQVWALDERFGPVAGEMIHVGFNRPELFRVIMGERQASGLPHGGVERPARSPGGEKQASGLPHGGEKQASGLPHGEEKQASGLLHGEERQASGLLHGEEKQASGLPHGGEKQASGLLHGGEKQASGLLHGGERQASGLLHGEERQASGLPHGGEKQASGLLHGGEKQASGLPHGGEKQASGLPHGGEKQASGLLHGAAVMSFTRDLSFGPLNAKMNPADGQLYVVGFKVWGTTAQDLSGLARVRYTGAPRVLLKKLIATDQGVILTFNAKLDKALAADPANYSAERWNYQRTEKYGSPHLKTDGSSGQEWMTASSAYLSEDGQSVMIGFPEMKAGVHQMRVGWGIKSADGLPAQNTAYFTPAELVPFDGVALGFGELKVDLTPRAAVAVALGKASVEEGEKLYQMFGCMACHSTDGTLQGKVGPSWKGLYGSERDIAGKKPFKVKADAAYLRESILNPGAKVVKGFEKFDAGMPIYEGILNKVQVESLVLFIESLR
jgi:hypothetical protein